MRTDKTILIDKSRELLRRHGERAEAVAREQMDAMMQAGDVKQAGFWLSVLQEIQLQRVTPKPVAASEGTKH